MVKAIEMLVEEHKNILRVTEAIERECEQISSGKTVNEDFFTKVIDFIRNYADKLHHAKEEDILFKEFLKQAEQGRVHCNPIEQMLYEHDVGRSYVKALEEGVKESNKEKITKNALGYAGLIRGHIFKEDNVLYPMSEQALSKKTFENIQKAFTKINEKNKNEIEKYAGFARESEKEGEK
ncbi:hemerythrin domain-containing protein [Candidatus Pacearchaeota archaeon]|nr:hemerythrin domain-containing protein [Candidatus Pacearchaeota archaeon]